MTGSIVHILNHALMKCSLFLAVGAIFYKVGVVHIEDFKGLGKRMPFTMAAFTLAALSMIGVPLTVGFISKWYLATGAIDAGMWYLIPVILASSLLTVVYFWRIVEYQLPDTRHHCRYFYPHRRGLSLYSHRNAQHGRLEPASSGPLYI